MKKMLIITAHPKETGTANLLCNIFEKTLDKKKFKVTKRDLYKMNIPRYSFQNKAEIPENILKIQEAWSESDILVFFMPNWWGTSPIISDLLTFCTRKIAIFNESLRPKKQMKDKKVLWITTGAAPWIIRKILFKTDPEKWGKYIFSFSGAKFKGLFFDGVGYGTGKLKEKDRVKIERFARSL